MESTPRKGTHKGDFFYRPGNKFREIDEARQPVVEEAQDELETNDVQFKALKQDVLLQMFEPGLQDNENLPQSSNLFSIGNRTGHFVCACPNGILFGETSLLRAAFEDAKPKTTAKLNGAYKLDLPETPTHVRFTAEEHSVIIVMPHTGVTKTFNDSTTSSFPTPPIIDILTNPSRQHDHLLAYIARTFPDSPYGKVFLYDMSKQQSMEVDEGLESSCMTFSDDGEILMICTKSGEVLYYDITNVGNCIPIRRQSPPDLPPPDDDSWWIIQGVHWIDTWNQLVIYNHFTYPSDPPVHEYQAYIISNPCHLSHPSAINYKFIKLPTPPVDAFGNTSLKPWFWFQAIHDWKPGIQDLITCSVTAGSDIGLLGRGDDGWSVWVTEDENRRATVPYDMEKNEETIVAGMQLDFTADKKISKPLYPDEDPVDCEALPILWLLNTSGQLAGWTLIYVPGIKSGERPVSMLSLAEQDQHWLTKRETRLKLGLSSEESNDKSLWETEWRKALSVNDSTTTSKTTAVAPPEIPQMTPEKSVATTPPQPSPNAAQSPPSRPDQPSTLDAGKSTIEQESQPGTAIATFGQTSLLGQSKPTFGQPSQLGATTPAFGQLSQFGSTKPAAFGQTGQLGGSLPGQSGLYSSFAPGLNASRTGHVFGQPTGLGGFGNSTGGGFAKYTSPQSGGAFLSGSSASTSSFLSGTQAGSGSFLQGGQTSGSGSFLQGGANNVFTKSKDQGFERFATPGRGFGTNAPSSFSDGGFLTSKSSQGGTTPASPFGVTQKGPSPFSERTQSLNASEGRSQSYDMLEDDSEETDEESESDLSESGTDEEDGSASVDVVTFGDSGFDLNLNDSGLPPAREEALDSAGKGVAQNIEQNSASMEASASSLSPSDEYVKVNLSSTPSPKLDKSITTPEQVQETAPAVSFPAIPKEEQSELAIAPLPNELPSHLRITPPRVEKAAIPSNPVVVTAQQTRQSANPTVSVAQESQGKRTPFPPEPATPQSRPFDPRIVQHSTVAPNNALPNDVHRQTPSPSSRKVELRQFVPVAGTTRISSKLTDSSNLSDAFRLVIDQVSKELSRLSENANTLTEYVQYQNERRVPKTADDLENPDDWTFADLEAMARIVEADMKPVEESTRSIPDIDNTIQEVEKSLKKMEAKKLELERFVRAVKDNEVRDSIYSRKLAPDFARQQKEIRHSLQDTEEKLKGLASALTTLKADLADEKGSFGIHSPSTAGIYRVTNNVLSRLQLLSSKVSALERKAYSKGARLDSPLAEGGRTTISRGSAMPATPVTKMGLVRSSPVRVSPGLRGSPGAKESPGMKNSPLRRTMLDERLDPWEADEIIRESKSKREFNKRIGALLKGREPLSTKASM